jgi:hypothetical protein
MAGIKGKTQDYEVVYWELTRISRLVRAKSMEHAIAKSERLRRKNIWEDCQEDSEGTNGVERVYLYGTSADGKPTCEMVMDAGTMAGLPTPEEEKGLFL